MPRKRPLTTAQVKARMRQHKLNDMMRGVPPPPQHQKLKCDYHSEDLGDGVWGHIININRIGIPVAGQEISGPVYAMSMGKELPGGGNPSAPAPFFACGGSVERMVWGRRMSRVERLAGLLYDLEDALPKLAEKWDRRLKDILTAAEIEPGHELYPPDKPEADIGPLWVKLQQVLNGLELASIRPDHEMFPKSADPEEQKIITPDRTLVVASTPAPVVDNSADGI